MAQPGAHKALPSQGVQWSSESQAPMDILKQYHVRPVSTRHYVAKSAEPRTFT